MRSSADDARLNVSDHWLHGPGLSLPNVRPQKSSAYHGIQEREERGNKNAQPSSSFPESTTLADRRSLSLQSDGSWEEEETPVKNSERPKIVKSQNRATAFLHFVIFHAIPIAGALVLIYLNLRRRFYGPTIGNWVQSLQFVAKAHEMLMTLSIVTVMVAYLQHLLTGKRYVPFGAIFSAYQVTSISYLWSPELRGTLAAADFPWVLKLVFLCFVFISTLLAAAVGPSSAIALQPRPVNFTTPGWSAALNVTSELLYPDAVDEAGPPLDAKQEHKNEFSPAAGWQYLQELPSVGLAYTTVEVGMQADSFERTKSVMPSLYSVKLLTERPTHGYPYAPVEAYRTLYIQYASNSTFATVQHIPVAMALSIASRQFNFYLDSSRPGIATANIKMAQPYASSICQFNSIYNGSDERPIIFPNSYITDVPCSLTGCDRDSSITLVKHSTTRADIWNQLKNSTEGTVIWVDDPVPGVPLGAIFVQPESCTGTNTTYRSASACLVGARWANTTSRQQTRNRMDTSGTPDVIENVIKPDSLLELPKWSEPSITFSKVWAESLNPSTDIQNRTVVDTLLRWLPTNEIICPALLDIYGYAADDILTRAYMHEKILSSLVANGLSHVVGATEIWEKQEKRGSSRKIWSYYDGDDNERADPPGMVLQFQGFLPGYAWSMDGTAIKIAIPVLLLYCLYAVSYVVYTFVTGRSSMTWRSLSELTALAINSTPNKALKNTSAGISETSTFQKLVGVREVEEHERLELVFGHDADTLTHRRITVGRAY
ncbi:hypothetical protein PVAG01_09789 [Phlyctema vagabunda]|uniref:Uncharacterized protein n=1 Tax=Phlyctema vagabunda TaxID=108571 RepID=A0ABR4P441_9HELO